MSTYIHYGCTEFKPELFQPIKNQRMFSKPTGGLWASPTDAKKDWKNWCIENDFGDCDDNNCFRFSLADGAKVLKLTHTDQLLTLPHITPPIYCCGTHCLDFQAMLRSGVDAVEVTMTGGLYMALYGWDVDSIIIMNPNIIVPILLKEVV